MKELIFKAAEAAYYSSREKDSLFQRVCKILGISTVRAEVQEMTLREVIEKLEDSLDIVPHNVKVAFLREVARNPKMLL